MYRARRDDPIVWYVRFPEMRPQRLALSCQVTSGGRRIVLLDRRLRGRKEVRDALIAKLAMDGTEIPAQSRSYSVHWNRLQTETPAQLSHPQVRRRSDAVRPAKDAYRAMKGWQLKIEYFSAMATGRQDDAEEVVKEIRRRQTSRKPQKRKNEKEG